MRWSLIALLIILVGFALWVRLAPTDAARYHVDLDFDTDSTGKGSARRVVDGGQAAFAALHAQIMTTPRTQLIAGDPAAGHATYETRSKVFGFPDYTTMQTGADGRVRLYGRLRYGASDMGVNAKRLDGWIARINR